MLQIITTQDGSPTIFHSELNTSYHSIYGAVQESKYVFIQNGLIPLLNTKKEKIKILEIGFGTGLNCLLTYLEWKNFSNYASKSIDFIGIEKYPIDDSMITLLQNYPPFNEHKNIFQQMHSIKANTHHKFDNKFQLKILHLDVIADFHTIEENEIDLIYYDAFAPSAQPKMWEKNIFELLYKKMNDSAILVTFCAQGQFKRNLKDIGFIVETLKGAPGKREMTRAIK